MTVLHLRQLNVSKLGPSGLDLLAIIATPQIGQGLIGGRCSEDIASPIETIALSAQPARLEVGPKQHGCKGDEGDGDRNHRADGIHRHRSAPSV
jgi:hypothetical protein